ncbi:MAG: AEC family transporter [Solobacterium sp.]|nr:AEC family transporter [Solobacterium sp.]
MGSQLLLIIEQIVIMMALMAVGYVIYKIRMIDDYTTKQLSSLILYVVVPCIMLVSFTQEYSYDKFIGFFIALIASFVIIFIGIFAGRIILGKDTGLEQYACGFSNAGIIGIPLVSSVLGTDYVFYVSAFFAAFFITTWTYGEYLIEGPGHVNLKKVITNPVVICTVVGIGLFVFNVKLPDILKSACNSIGGLNTPLGMMMLGTYIAKEDLGKMFKNKMCYLVSLIRLIIVPLICLFILKFVYVPFEQIKMVLLICACSPCAATLAMFSQMCGKDYSYGARMVSLSTLFSPVTMVFILSLATLIW